MVLATAVMLLLGAASAAAQRLAATGGAASAAAVPINDGIDTGFSQTDPGRNAITAALAQQHGGSDQHLPPTQQNIELVSKLQMSTPAEYRTPATADRPVMPDQIADVAVYKNYAYLNSWSEETCRRGGIFVVDIADPARPRQVAFLPALPDTRHGEGAHVITIGGRDVLAVNNEALPPPCPQGVPHGGGFDLWDVTNPLNPQPLALSVGDTGPDDGSLFTDDPEDAEPVHQSHSTFMWKNDQGRAFVVFTDNTELHDLDIFEITDPANPRPVAEFDLATRFPQVVDDSALGDWIYHHDVVVKKIDGVYTMLVDYWDAGYVLLNVDNPANPQYITDSSFDGLDPLTGKAPPEGNAHQGEFSHDNRYVLAADEDFDAYAFRGFIDGEPNNFGVGIPVTPAGVAIPELLPSPGNAIDGDTRYIGDGCVLATVPAPQAGESVAVAERGTCDFDVKAANAAASGYEAILIFNNVLGPAPRCEATNLNIIFDDPNADIQALLIPRAVGFQIIGAYDPNTYRCVRDDPTSTPAPAPNRAGLPVRLEVEFDGWGYTHLYDRTRRDAQGKMLHVDAHAVEEGLNPAYAFGYGDISVHEFAADPTENVAYSSYYSAGMRVFTSGPGGLTEQGKFIDQGGNDFWGVEQFTSGNVRYFAGSDRDFGLYIFRYTGPGAAVRPVCTDSMTMVPYRGSASVALPCSDANGNPLTRSITDGPSAGTVSGNPSSGAVAYQHTGRRVGVVDALRFVANDGTMSSEPATARIVTVPREGGRCFNRYEGSDADEELTGSPFGDRLLGRGGKDTIRGLGSGDCLLGQGGRDQLLGDTGNDRLFGGRGRDRVFGEAGRDRLYGGAADDHVRGSSGHDRVYGGGSNDHVDGGSNNDRVYGGDGDDRLRGGPGRDRVYGGSGDDRLEAGDAPMNRLSGGGGDDKLLAANGKRDTLSCGRGRDIVEADSHDSVSGDCEVVNEAD